LHVVCDNLVGFVGIGCNIATGITELEVRRLVWLILNFINATGIKDASMLLEVRSKEHSFRAKTSRWTSFENDQAALKLIYTLQVTIIKKIKLVRYSIFL
jgi:hypothetical protein